MWSISKRVLERMVVVGLVLGVCWGCAHREKGESALQAADFGFFLGRIVAVNADLGFVIVDATNAFAIPEGERAEVRREQQLVGEVRFDRQRAGQFAAANVVRGDLQRGDEVYYRR